MKGQYAFKLIGGDSWVEFIMELCGLAERRLLRRENEVKNARKEYFFARAMVEVLHTMK